MTLDEFHLASLVALRSREFGIRLGQFWFGQLHAVRPDLTSKLYGNPVVDPYHDDRNLVEFWTWLKENW